jgi:hypothetical protein
LHADEDYVFTFELERANACVGRPYTPGYAKQKEEGWTLLLGLPSSNGGQLLAIKRRAFVPFARVAGHQSRPARPAMRRGSGTPPAHTETGTCSLLYVCICNWLQ